MRRVGKHFTFLLFCIGLILLCVFVLHIQVRKKNRSPFWNLLQKPSYADLTRRVDTIEREIESQVSYSNNLLLKVKANLASHSKLDTLQDTLPRRVLGGRPGHGFLQGHKNVTVSKEAENSEAVKVKHTGAGGEQLKETVIAILVLVCNRPSVTRCLDKLLKHRPSETKFPIIVSEDCGRSDKILKVLQKYDKSDGTKPFLHIFQPDLSKIKVEPGHSQYTGYYKIARHYGWALNYTFNVLHYSNVIIVEDDLEISSDFFEYFSATLPVLNQDPSLWCVSAWNDNGKADRIDMNAPGLLHRTDFFPGLGWMLTSKLWSELAPKWPRAFWDDWMREPTQRQNRSCIRPEISRTSTFGKVGVSRGAFFNSHLKYIVLNKEFVRFSALDLSYLLRENYDKQFLNRVNSASLLNSWLEFDVAKSVAKEKEEFKLIYRNRDQFVHLANDLGIMDDFKADIPRTAYLGIVSTMLGKHRIYLTPSSNWSGYYKAN